jgi:hypothetical protein
MKSPPKQLSSYSNQLFKSSCILKILSSSAQPPSSSRPFGLLPRLSFYCFSGTLLDIMCLPFRSSALLVDRSTYGDNYNRCYSQGYAGNYQKGCQDRAYGNSFNIPISGCPPSCPNGCYDGWIAGLDDGYTQGYEQCS